MEKPRWGKIENGIKWSFSYSVTKYFIESCSPFEPACKPLFNSIGDRLPLPRLNHFQLPLFQNNGNFLFQYTKVFSTLKYQILIAVDSF